MTSIYSVYLLVLAVFLLANDCSSASTNRLTRKVESIDDSAASTNLTIQNGEDVSKINFAILNDQQIRPILDRLNLSELLNVAKINSRLNSIACEAFRSKYKDNEISIRGSNKLKSKNYIDHSDPDYAFKKGRNILSDGKSLTTGETFISINEAQMKTDILQYFGKCMNQLEIVNFNMEENQSKVLNKMANEYAADSITSLRLNTVKKETFEQYTRPFKEVEAFTFICWTEDLNETNIKPFNELFPKLKNLSAILTPENEYSFLEHTYPLLEYMDIQIDPSFRASYENAIIDNLIQKNRHIKNLDLYVKRIQNARLIYELFPNIENLTLKRIQTDNETIRFERVKKFELFAEKPGDIDKISLPRLETLKINYNPAHPNEWSEFFKRHQTVTRLDMFTDDIHFNDFAKIAAEFKNLIEIKCGTYNDINIDNAIKMIQDHEKLQKIKFSLSKQTDVDTLHKELDHEWNIKVHDLHFIPIIKIQMNRKIIV